jgi:hypothetical protein
MLWIATLTLGQTGRVRRRLDGDSEVSSPSRASRATRRHRTTAMNEVRGKRRCGGAFRIQKLLKDHGGDPDHRDVDRTDPPVVAAYRLRHGDPRLRAETNARLLADQPVDGITARTGVPADVVTAYEQLFYNVTDVLACTAWIAARCLGPRFFTDFCADDVDVIMGWFGYCFGPQGLDDLIDSLCGESPVWSGRREAGPTPPRRTSTER